MQPIILILVLLLGSSIGSFLNVVILRLPEEKKLNGRSHCPACGRILGFWDLFPILSFLFLGGKCRYCHKKISARYFVIELVTALIFALAWLALKPDSIFSFVLLLKYWFVCAVLIVVFVIDLEHYLILDPVIVWGGCIALIFNLVLDVLAHHQIFSLHSYFVSGILAALAAALPFFSVWYFSKGLWMGFGDVKLALFLGLALLWPSIFAGLMVGVLLGGFVSGLLLLFTSKTLKSQLPFGTFLSIGAFFALLYGEKLIHWYLAILGF